MVSFGSVVLHVENVSRAAQFWTRALGYKAQEGGDPAFLAPPDGQGPELHLDKHDRTHLDLHAADEREQQAEVERLLALGARRVDWAYPPDADFVVLADTEGNLFCVVNASHGD